MLAKPTFVRKSCDFKPELPEYTSRTKFALKSCDVRARAARVHFACSRIAIFQPELPELLSYLKVASPSYQSTLRALFSYSKIVNPELAECISRTTFVLKSCDFPARAARVHFAYYFRTSKLQFSSRAAARAHVYHFRTQNCDFQARAGRVHFANYFRT